MGNYLPALVNPRPEPKPEPKPEPEPEPTLLTEPWRRTESAWNDKYLQKLVQELEKFSISDVGIKEADEGEKVTQAKCLLLGPISVGKSSFINSVISICNNRLSNVAYTAGESWGTVTHELRFYGGKNDLGRRLSLCDVSGLKGAKDAGFNVDNIIYLINGNVKQGYTFDAMNAISADDKLFKHNPMLQDKMHCAAFVVAANKLSALDKNYKDKIRRLQTALKRKGVPRILVLTKCDLLCKEVDKDVNNLFQSIKVKEAVDNLSSDFAIPKSNIHPIVNYGERQVYLDAATSIPILLAVRQMMHFTNDFIDNDAVERSYRKQQANARLQ